MTSGRSGAAGRARLAVVAAGVLGGACLALVSYVVARTPGRDHSPVVVIPALLAFTAIGAVIVWRRPGQRMGWLLLTVPLLGLVTGSAAYGVLFIADLGAAVASDAVLVAQALLLAGDLAIFATLSIVFLAFPDGRLLSPRWRAAVALTAAAYLLVRAAQVTEPGPVVATFPDLANPFGMADRSGVWSLPATWAPMATVAFVALPVALVVRFHRSRGAARLQMKWLAYTTVVWVVFLIVSAVAALPEQWRWLDDLVLLPLALLVLPVGVGVAVLRYRLYDIDRIVDRTLLYAALTACVVAGYAAVVTGLSLLVPVGGDVFGSLVAAVVVALGFQPLRHRLQTAVNRLMYGDRDDPYRVLSRLGQRLGDAVPGSQVAATVVQTVADALKLPYVAVTFTSADGDPPPGDPAQIVASTGQVADHVEALPLTYRGQPVGDLLVAPRSPGERFSDADRRLLSDLVRHCGAALYAARQADHTRRLALDLQRARRDLVGAREEERRRLRRDLHDGLGPTLSGQALTIDAVRALMATDPHRVDSLLTDMKAQAQQALADIRRVVYQLRPPALDDLGLTGVLTQTAEDYNAVGLHVTTRLPPALPPLPAAVEVATYRIVHEALTNVARHAQARSCTVSVTLSTDPCGLRIDVVDDGRGIGTGDRAGVGIVSMRERADELGGYCRIGAAIGGGTQVSAWLPIDTRD